MTAPTSRRIKKPLRTAFVEAGKRSEKFRTWSRGYLYARRGRQYRAICANTPMDPKTIVFECYGGRGYACSPRAIYEAMLADDRFDDHRFVWVMRPDMASALAERGLDVDQPRADEGGPALVPELDRLLGEEAIGRLERATIVPFGERPYYEAHARAGTWVANYIVPVHLQPRVGQTYLQTWHGTPLKRLGCDIALGKSNAMFSVADIHKRYRHEGARFTHLVSPSAFTSEKLATAFDLVAPGRTDAILETGYPRNDFLHSVTAEQIAALKARLGVPPDKRVVLYAPTFRDTEHSGSVGYTFRAELDFDLLRERLGSDTVILFRPHYLVANSFDFIRHEGFVIDASAILDINDLYVVSDTLVTDYSSVMFDYANLGRPMVFFMPDLETYARDLRGFYLELADLPGRVTRTQDELAAAILAVGEPDAGLAERYRRFRERFTYLDDGQASQRVIERVMAP